MTDRIATFTKNAKTGAFDVITNHTTIKAGDPIVITKRNGQKQTETVDSVGRVFTSKFGDLQGQQCVICTLKPWEKKR